MTQQQAIYILGTKVMGWGISDGDGCLITADGAHQHSWNPLTNAEHSKQIRDRLVEIGWFWTLGRLGNGRFGFSAYLPDRHTSESEQHENEFYAVALVALRVAGEKGEIE